MYSFQINTQEKHQMINIDHFVQEAISKSGIQNGLITVFSPHTTTAITINENADPDVQKDILRRLDELVPSSSKDLHAEGNSDAHLKASLIGSSVQVPVVDGKIKLGRWQSVFFCEFDGPREREVWVKK